MIENAYVPKLYQHLTEDEQNHFEINKQLQ